MSYADDPDFDVEPIPGLPEALPAGESILWQGRPDALALARSSLALDWVAGYFALLAAWRVGVSVTVAPPAEALAHALPFLGLGLAACGLIYLFSWVQARATLYTITTERVAMRIGAALTITLNMPFPRIASADLSLARGGTGSIALAPLGDTRLSYLVLWPHVRPWRMRRTEPALRCIPDAEAVAAILARAADARVSRPEVTLRAEAIAAE